MRSILWLSLIAGLWLAGCDRREVPVTTLPSEVVPATEEPILPPPPVKAPPQVRLPAPLHKPQPPAPDQAAAIDGEQPGPGGDVTPPGDGPPAADAVPAPPTDGASQPPGTIAPPPDTTEAALKNPEEVIGLDLAQISRLLGEPAFRTEQPPAKVWSYAGSGCAMRVFVYPDIKSRVFRALTYEIQGTDGSPLAKRRCFTGLIKQHAA
jgi:hypothetical protein